MTLLSVPVELPTVDPLADLVIEPSSPAAPHPPTPADEWARLITGEGHPPLTLTRRPDAAHAQRPTWRERRRAILDRLIPLVPEGHAWAEPSRLDHLDGIGNRA